jgi:hypothetical protein
MDVTSRQDLPGMETYKPEEPSGITIRDVVDEVDGKTRRVRIINFGIQDAERARHFGRELAGYEFDAVQGEAEIWREAWLRYPNSRLFARCFAHEAKKGSAETKREPT